MNVGEGPNGAMDRKRVKGEDEGAEPGSKKTKRSSQACVYCQRLKMKCSGTLPCERCIRVGRECKLPQQAVRQPWSRKKDMEIQMLNSRLEEMERRLHEKEAGGYTSGGSEASSSTPQRAHEGLTTNDSIAAVGSSASEATLRLPFVHSGFLTFDEAKELFDLFMHNCVLHVALVDPEWHTFSRVSRDCRFLFACVVFIASTYHQERAALREELQGEMNELIGRVVATGEKSISIVQGFLFLYFFNVPPARSERDTSWLYSGIAIRIASELNLGSTTRVGKETTRERIDRERTWMMTFVVDRSLSTTRGKAWTIRGDDSLVRNSDSWCDQPGCRSWDRAISTLADLLKVTSRQIDALNTALSATAEYDDTFDCETMMRIMNEELEEWRRRWQARGAFLSPLEGEATSQGGMSNSNFSSPMSEEVDVHKRTLHYLSKQGSLRFNYAVLVLNCFGLQYCASHPEKASARTYSLSQAIRAAQNVVKAAMDGLRYTVAYSPHSQCTILTFGVVSLIKLASLKRVDEVVSQRLIQMVESGIAFLESVAIRPTHVAARSASFLRGLLRRSLMGDATDSSFRPGMDMHSLPAQSSRSGTPTKESVSTQASLMTKVAHTNSGAGNHYQHYAAAAPHHAASDPHLRVSSHVAPQQQSIGDESGGILSAGTGINMDLPWTFTGDDALDLLANADPSILFGKEGSTGFGGLTADELLDDSFWLRLPHRSPV